jgi:hypothetical protein
MKRIVTTALLCGFTMSSAHAALVDRGGGMIYDDVLRITCLADASYAKTSGYDTDGKLSGLGGLAGLGRRRRGESR